MHRYSSRSVPPFPDDICAYSLPVIDYEKIQSGDHAEKQELWKIATELGFWYLKNHGIDAEVDNMFAVAEAALDLPFDEKVPYERGRGPHISFGYKLPGSNPATIPELTEFLNIARDDILAYPRIPCRTYPPAVQELMQPIISRFARNSAAVNATLLDVFHERLGLPEGTLVQLHSEMDPSACEVRCTKSLPLPSDIDERRATVGAHTDFGTLTLLHNRLGGLQVPVKDTNEWQYVKPLSGHAICNIADALVIFSGGILRSSMHRVVAPPGEQAHFVRHSLVYFTRPADRVHIRALVEKSTPIAEAVRASPPGSFETGMTAAEWLVFRVKGQRERNQKGSQSLEYSSNGGATPLETLIAARQ